MLRSLTGRIVATPVDAASLAAFRILFGVLMAAAAIRVLALGWVDEFYVQPAYHFTWDLFPWVRPMPPPLMQLHFVALAILACGIAIGFRYRACAAMFFVGVTYVELIDKTTYLNHYYLVSLLSALLIVVPANRIWSVDAWRRSIPEGATIPSWTINILRFQLAVVYAFAGLAKVNADWLLDAEPLRIWLAARSDLPIVGSWFTQPWVAYAFSWSGALFDLSIVPWLLWRRSRPAAYVVVIVFHTLTWLLFPIGMFPWIMIVATLVFFPPDWPRRWVGRPRVDVQAARPGRYAVPAWTVACLAVYSAIQIALPLRAYWPGMDPEWTNRGFNFAWRVMLIEKAGYVEFVVRDPATGRQWPVRARDYLTERQEKMMAQDPFMVRALARHVAADLAARGFPGVEVRADAFATLNGRPLQRFIDPRVDLAGPETAEWLLPRVTGDQEIRSKLLF